MGSKWVVVYSVLILLLASDAISQEFDLSTIDSSNGFIINGVNSTDQVGFSVSNIGDLNGDDIDDLIIGAPNAADPGGTQTGTSYVVFGDANGFNTTLDLANLNGINGFSIIGINSGDNSGYSVSGAGDINNDGIDDILIGAPGANFNGSSSVGTSYVIFGRSAGFPITLNLSNLNENIGFAIHGMNTSDFAGSSVSNAGDINGDGIDDIIIGASGAAPNGTTLAGESYVVFGNNTGFPNPLELSNLDESNGFAISGVSVGDRSGWSVGNAGDVNGDGIDDIIISAYQANPDGNNNAGTSYIIYGNSNGFGHTLELSSLDGTNGFVINGLSENDELGHSVGAAGDINGDGIDDIIIGAPGVSEKSGASYVIFGNNSGFSSPFYPTALNGANGFVINGNSLSRDSSGRSVSSAGDVNGDHIGDLIIGAPFGGLNDEGVAYVVLGQSSGFSSSLELSNLDGVNGYLIYHSTDNLSFPLIGHAVSSAGDINGDNISDIIIGAPFTSSETGRSYVVFGSDMIFSSGFESD